jgi:hypothetical protein
VSDLRPVLSGLVPIPTYRGTPATVPADLTGVDLDGHDVTVAVTGVGHWTLLLFLSMRCDGCGELWDVLAGSGPEWPHLDDVRTVVVVRPPDAADGDELRRRVGPRVRPVVSEAAYRRYRVHGPPFFVVVAGASSRVVTEGVAWGAAQVVDHVRRARAGDAEPEVQRLDPPPVAR